MADDVSVSTPLTTNDVTFSFTETSSPVSVSSPISVSDVLVTVNEVDNSVAVSVTDTITDVSVTVDNTTQPVSVAVTESVTTVDVNIQNVSANWAESFDTVSRNLRGFPYIVYWDGDSIDYVVFSNGITSITKTFNYTGDKLTSIVLSGDTPNGISLTKSLLYSGDKIQSVTYS